MARFIPLAGLVALLSASAGCSTFDQDWEGSKGHAVGIEGQWEGTWSSDANGHHGGLRCLVTRRGDGAFDARYHATYSGWCGTLGFEYTVPMTLQPDRDGWLLEGDADLGWLAGGKYEYNGRATPSRFTCTFQSEEDHGVFLLQRPR